MVTVIEALIRHRQRVPLPKANSKGTRIAVPVLLAAKMALHNEMLAQNINKSELGRRLKQHLPQIDRLVNVRHGSQLDQLEAAFGALGKRLEITVVDALSEREVAADRHGRHPRQAK